jgi:hypothetical protein
MFMASHGTHVIHGAVHAGSLCMFMAGHGVHGAVHVFMCMFMQCAVSMVQHLKHEVATT